LLIGDLLKTPICYTHGIFSHASETIAIVPGLVESYPCFQPSSFTLL
jgi:hypothetical protein